MCAEQFSGDWKTPPREAEVPYSDDLESVPRVEPGEERAPGNMDLDDHSTSTSNRDRDDVVVHASEGRPQEAQVGRPGVPGQPETELDYKSA